MFGDIARQIYYTIHAFCFFLVPLVYMIVVQKRVFLSLRSSVASNTINTISASMRYERHYKVAKVLAALTIAFAICWSPFMVTRTMLYFHLTSGGYVWRASQLSILLNTALDPIFIRSLRRSYEAVCSKFIQENKTAPVSSWGPSPRQTRKSASNGFTSH